VPKRLQKSSRQWISLLKNNVSKINLFLLTFRDICSIVTYKYSYQLTVEVNEYPIRINNIVPYGCRVVYTH